EVRPGQRRDLCTLGVDRFDLPAPGPLRDAHGAREPEAARGPRDRKAVISGAYCAHAPPTFGVRELGDSVPHPSDLERPESLEILQLEPHVLVSRERDGWSMPANLSDDRQGRVDIAERHLDTFHRDILAARGRPAGTIGSSHRDKGLHRETQPFYWVGKSPPPGAKYGGGKATLHGRGSKDDCSIPRRGIRLHHRADVEQR